MALPATRLPFNFGRLRPGDVAAGIASFLVFISVFFPWYSFAASAAQSGDQATPAQQQLVLAGGTARAVPYHWQALVGITAFQGLLVLIAFVANPLSILDSLGSSSWAFGLVFALIAAIAAVGGAILVMRETKKPPAFSSTTAHAPGA